MASVNPDEIQVGLVVHLLPATAILAGGCKINVSNRQQARMKARPFLILVADDESNEAIATPLYSSNGQDRVALDNSLKSGHVSWTNRPSFYHRMQQWKLSYLAIQRGSEEIENSPENHRNYYDRLASAQILSEQQQANESEFRSLP